MTADQIVSTVIEPARAEMQRCTCDLLIADIRRECYADVQADLVAQLLRKLAPSIHDEWAKNFLVEAAANLESLARDLEQGRIEAQEELEAYWRTRAGRYAKERGYD